MKECPFCGALVKPRSIDFNFNSLSKNWILFHNCNVDSEDSQMGILISAKTEQEVIDIWDGRYEEQKSESL